MSAKKNLTTTLVLSALLLSTPAMAQDDPRNVDKSGPFFGETATGKWLIGLKYGNMLHNADGFSSGNNAGFMLGYEFSRPVFYGRAAVEFEYLWPTSDGSFNGFDNPNDPSGQPDYPYDGEWQNWVRSLYAVYRGPGTLYFKGKAGLTATRFDATFSNPPAPIADVRKDKTTVGWGVGLGVHAGKWIDIELEYAGNQGDSDLNYVSLGANARF